MGNSALFLNIYTVLNFYLDIEGLGEKNPWALLVKVSIINWIRSREGGEKLEFFWSILWFCLTLF